MEGQQVRKFMDVFWGSIMDQALTALYAKDTVVNMKDLVPPWKELMS